MSGGGVNLRAPLLSPFKKVLRARLRGWDPSTGWAGRYALERTPSRAWRRGRDGQTCSPHRSVWRSLGRPGCRAQSLPNRSRDVGSPAQGKRGTQVDPAEDHTCQPGNRASTCTSGGQPARPTSGYGRGLAQVGHPLCYRLSPEHVPRPSRRPNSETEGLACLCPGRVRVGAGWRAGWEAPEAPIGAPERW